MKRNSITELPKYHSFKFGGMIKTEINIFLSYNGLEYEYDSYVVIPTTYDNIVSTIMNTLYPSDKVQALTANYNEARDDEELSEEKRKEYMDEYHAYQEKRKEIKALAKEIMEEVTHGQV